MATTKTVPSTRGWCVGKVVFHNTTIDGASVKLKLYLNNPQAFYDFPADFQYGWLEVTVDASGDYPAPVYYPPSYMENGLEPSTTISFKVEECTAAPGFCGGTVTIYYEGGPPPP